MSDKFLVIDGNSLANRAFYAIPMLSNAQGFITNAIYGFYNMLARVVEEENPAYIAVAFDKGKVVFRHQYYADYKGTRKGTPDELRPQFPVLKDLLRVMNIAVFELEGYEGDDLIGTLVKQGEREGLINLIVTGDRDAFQLISSQTKVFLTRKGISELEIYDEQFLTEKYGLSPRQMIDVKGLMGDASDNIPGIPGVGEKTALKLVKKYGDLAKVLAHWEDFQGKKLGELLHNYKEQALLSKKLATIECDVPMEIALGQCRRREPDYPQLLTLLKELEFKSILQNTLDKWERARRETGEEISTEDSRESNLPAYVVLDNQQALADYLAGKKAEAAQGKQLTLYLETEKRGVRECLIVACGLKTKLGQPAVLSWQSAEELGGYLKTLKSYLENEDSQIILHDVKTALLALSPYQIQPRGAVKDTLLMAYLLNPSRVQSDLLSLIQERLNYMAVPQEEMRVPYFLVALEKLGDELGEELEKQEMRSLYQDLELPLAYVLAVMEQTGIRLDLSILEEMGRDFDTWIKRLTEEIYGMAGEKINLNSPKQLGILLFEKLGLPKGKKTKTGYSTSAEVLESLAPEHEIVSKVLDYRQLVKLKSTYIDGLSTLMDPVTERVYTSFNQAVTATGRLSSTEPNLQNIPIRLEEGRRIRRAFLPSAGNQLFSADYSQIELRVLAHIAGDEVLIEAFNHNQDIHTRTAAEVFGVPMEAVTPKLRRAAKAVNFGIVYGISDFGLSRDLGISRAEAKEYIASYFARYQGVKLYIDKVIAEAREKGYVTTLLNRRRYLPDILSRNFHLRSFAERTAMNTPIQGSAADIIKLAMLKLARVLHKDEPETALVLQVHDELILDVPSERVEKVGILVKRIMSEAYPLMVPLQVDLQTGINWYDLRPLQVK